VDYEAYEEYSMGYGKREEDISGLLERQSLGKGRRRDVEGTCNGGEGKRKCEGQSEPLGKTRESDSVSMRNSGK
jgi:hypothetical protein